MIKRFLLGGLLTAVLSFAPYSALVAIRVWGFGSYDPKFGQFGTWMFATQIAGIIAIAAVTAFVFSFLLLHRVTKRRPMWCYLIAIAIPVATFYMLMSVGYIAWLMKRVQPESFLGLISVGFWGYLPGILASVVISMVIKIPIQSSQLLPKDGINEN